MGAAGNEAFKAKEYKKAIGHYMQAGSPPPPGTSPHAPRSLAEPQPSPLTGGMLVAADRALPHRAAV